MLVLQNTHGMFISALKDNDRVLRHGLLRHYSRTGIMQLSFCCRLYVGNAGITLLHDYLLAKRSCRRLKGRCAEATSPGTLLAHVIRLPMLPAVLCALLLAWKYSQPFGTPGSLQG